MTVSIDFVDKQTVITTAWLNAVDAFVFEGGLSLIVAPVTASQAVLTGSRYKFDTRTVGAFTATLPTTPTAGITRVGYMDYYNTFHLGNLTWLSSDKNIEESSDDYIMDLQGASGVMLFVDDTVGWKDLASGG